MWVQQYLALVCLECSRLYKGRITPVGALAIASDPTNHQHVGYRRLPMGEWSQTLLHRLKKIVLPSVPSSCAWNGSKLHLIHSIIKYQMSNREHPKLDTRCNVKLGRMQQACFGNPFRSMTSYPLLPWHCGAMDVILFSV